MSEKSQLPAPLVSTELIGIVRKYKDELNAYIDYRRDFNYDFFGFKTLERSYLVKLGNKIVERPQHMLLRVSIGVHGEDMPNVYKTYDLLSHGWFIHATPTLFNAGTPKPQMSSCFLLAMKDDSIEGIYETLKQTALISKSAGGIGVSIHNIRASQSYIKGTNGTSNGLIPMLRVYNDTARYVDQGGGKRKGAFAIYLEPWHADIKDFLQLKKNHGKEEQRARDLFYALWICDLFMKRVESGGDWSLFCPAEAPGLHECWGKEFEEKYERYEREGRAREVIKAQDLWLMIIDSQIETGTPFMLYKDSCNSKSNQQNLGTIKSSNLCTEIIEYTDPDEVAVCNLASIALPKFVKEDKTFDHQRLYDVVYHITGNLNRVIDRNFYPIPEAERSNRRHRPVGLGVQGLADAFIKMRFPFESPEAAKANRDIFETIYFAALTRSKDLAKVEGPYETFPGSPASKGILQFDMWGVTPSDRWDWTSLKAEVVQHGIRNSLLLAPMPTASTSQILANTEAFEPYTTNIYTRRVLAGEFTVLNRHLLRDLMGLGLWNEDIKNQIIAQGGSVQGVPEIPDDLKELYKTVWEIKQRTLIDMAADRGAYIDQSQSFNVFIAQPNASKLTSMHFYAWKKGLKTGMYYLRTRPAADAIKFTVDQQKLKARTTDSPAKPVGTNAAAAATSATPVPMSPIAAAPAPEPEPEADGEMCRMEEGCLVCGS